MCFIHTKKPKHPVLLLNLCHILEYKYIYIALKHVFPLCSNISGLRLNRDMYRQNLLGNESSCGYFLGITVQFLFIVTSSGKLVILPSDVICHECRKGCFRT